MTELTPCETENPMGGMVTDYLVTMFYYLFHELMAEAALDKTRGKKTTHSDSLLCQMILQAMAKL